MAIMNYEQNTKYFTLGWGIGAIIVLILGILLLALAGTGIILIIIAFLIPKQYKNNDDNAIDSAIMSQLHSLKERALNKLGIDEDEVSEISPITFDGYNYNLGEYNCIRRGSDNLLRTNKYRAVMFLFSANELYCYTYDFSLTEDFQKESTEVYFYKDIVSVSTQTEGTSLSILQGKNTQFNYETFKLTTTGGTSISCAVRNLDDAQRSIKGMRALLKEKKNT